MPIQEQEETINLGKYLNHCECWFKTRAQNLMQRAPVHIRKAIDGKRLSNVRRRGDEASTAFDDGQVDPVKYVQSKGFSVKHQKELLAILKENPLKGYLFIGPTGVGKSFLLWALAKEAAYAGRKVIIQEASAFVDAAKSDQFVKPAEDRPDGMIYPDIDLVCGRYGPAHLFLDELDNVPSTDFSVRRIFDLMSYCYDHSDECVVSAASNMSLDQLAGMLGPATARRLESLCTQIVMGA